MILLASLVGAGGGWLLGTENGTQMLLTQSVRQFGGTVTDVRGSVLQGLSVGRLTISLPEVALDIVELRLDVQWRDIIRRRVHLRELSAQSLHVALNATTASSAASASLPVLPLQWVVDKLALGQFTLTQQGEVLPLQVRGLEASLRATAAGGTLLLSRLHLQHALAQGDFQGQADLLAMAEPWPFIVSLQAATRVAAADSPLCVRPGLGPGLGPALAAPCRVALQLEARGSLNEVALQLQGKGEGLHFEATSLWAPRTALPLLNMRLDLHLADGSDGWATLKQQQLSKAEGSLSTLSGALALNRLDVGQLLGGAGAPARVTAQANFDVQLHDLFSFKRATLALTVASGSYWNGEPLSAAIKGEILADQAAPSMQAGMPAAGARDLPIVKLRNLDIDVRLGPNRIFAQGTLSHTDSVVKLEANMPRLAAFWPSLAGAATVKGRLMGTSNHHRGELAVHYIPHHSASEILGRAPWQAALRFSGGWREGVPEASVAGWRGTLTQVNAQHAGFTLMLDRSLDVAFVPQALPPQWQWEVGAVGIHLIFPRGEQIAIEHKVSRAGGDRWEIAGKANNFVFTAAMAHQITSALASQRMHILQRRASQVNKGPAESQRRVVLDAMWHFRFDGALAGQARLIYRGGDLHIAADPPIPLSLQALRLDVTAMPVAPLSSHVEAKLTLKTAQMGWLDASGSATLTGLMLDPKQLMRAKADVNIDNMTWLAPFIGDKLVIDGILKAHIRAQGTLDGRWHTQGAIQGEKLRIVRVDDGARLLDGTLSARLDDDKLIVDTLNFPALQRVLPADRRTREWITHEADAAGGYVEASGVWNLWQSRGQARINMHRFPALQRADRYAMVSGQVNIDASLSRIAIAGALKADAGWFSLEILQEVPALDDDVYVRRAGGASDASATPLAVSLDLDVDMGPRFFITGMGLDASLLGAIHIDMQGGRLHGMGALRTRGSIEAYGQKLQLRRGTLTFQGKLENPVLDIEALRTGQQVEAGIKVGGTAQRPRIDLFSQPDVSEVEKLSWLILGRGPDESGSDAALLLSVGNALLSGEQPFYKQFGLDEVSIRSGAIGSSGSLLPDQTVAGSTNRDSNSSLATQFLVASKRFANGITLSMEQALAGTDTVVRFSYRLTRSLSLDIKGGGVNGIAVVYRLLFDN